MVLIYMETLNNLSIYFTGYNNNNNNRTCYMYIKACRMSVKRMSSNDLLVNRLSVAWQRLPWAEHSLVLSRDIIVTSGITAASTPPVQPACLSLLQRHAVGTPSTLTHMHMCTRALLLAQTRINIFIHPSLGCHMQLYHILIP